MVRDAVRRFVEAEVVPHIDELEHGDLPPYDIIRKLYATFGMDQMARDRFKRAARAQGRLRRRGRGRRRREPSAGGGGGAAAMTLIPIIELCHYCPGIVTAMGVSLGLAGGTIMKQGTPGPDGALGRSTCSPPRRSGPGRSPSPTRARTPSAACSRPPGGTATSTSSTATRPSSPTAPTPTPSSSTPSSTTDRTPRSATARCSPSCSRRGWTASSSRKPFRKMGLHSSPTGELFLTDVRVGQDHLLGRDRGRDAAGAGATRPRATSSPSGPAWRPCRSVSSRSASSSRSSTRRTAMLWGQPIGDRQLIQLKLAKMEVARLNVAEPGLPPHRDCPAAGKSLTLAEASAMKLYSAQAASEVAMEAVQLFGGNGYMAEFRVEQLGPRRQGLPDLRRDRRDPGHPHRQGPARAVGAPRPADLSRREPVRGPTRRRPPPGPPRPGRGPR